MTSRYAKKVRRLLRKIYPTPQPILKEVSLGEFAKDIELSKSVKDLIKLYEARLGRMKVDFWVKHQVAIEVHGEQHEQEIRFSNEIEDLAAELQRRKGLDLVKQQVLNEAGVPIVIVWYYEIADLTAAALKEKIIAAQSVADAATPKRRRAPDGGTVPKVSRLGTVRRTWQAKRPTRLGGNKREQPDRKSTLEQGKTGKVRKPMVGKTIRRPAKGQSKLSRDWKRHKEERDD